RGNQDVLVVLAQYRVIGRGGGRRVPRVLLLVVLTLVRRVLPRHVRWHRHPLGLGLVVVDDARRGHARRQALAGRRIGGPARRREDGQHAAVGVGLRRRRDVRTGFDARVPLQGERLHVPGNLARRVRAARVDVDTLWGDAAPRSALENLRTHAHALRSL